MPRSAALARLSFLLIYCSRRSDWRFSWASGYRTLCCTSGYRTLLDLSSNSSHFPPLLVAAVHLSRVEPPPRSCPPRPVVEKKARQIAWQTLVHSLSPKQSLLSKLWSLFDVIFLCVVTQMRDILTVFVSLGSFESLLILRANRLSKYFKQTEQGRACVEQIGSVLFPCAHDSHARASGPQMVSYMPKLSWLMQSLDKSSFVDCPWFKGGNWQLPGPERTFEVVWFPLPVKDNSRSRADFSCWSYSLILEFLARSSQNWT